MPNFNLDEKQPLFSAADPFTPLDQPKRRQQEQAERLKEVLYELLRSEGVALPFPLGSLLPIERGARVLHLDAGVDTLEKRALVFKLTLMMLPETHTVRADDSTVHTKKLRMAPLASQVRQNMTDWLTWQDATLKQVQTLLAADQKLLPQSLLAVIDDSSEYDPQLEKAWIYFYPTQAAQEYVAEKWESFREKLVLNYRNDTYIRSVSPGKADAPSETVKQRAARKDQSAFQQPAAGSYRKSIRTMVSPAELDTVRSALALPFGGRTLLAATYMKLVLNHQGLLVSSTGAPSPVGPLVQDRALQVLNTLAAQRKHGLAAIAASMAAPLRLLQLRLGTSGGDALPPLPDELAKALPSCFRRDALHDPRITLAQAKHVFKHCSDSAQKAYFFHQLELIAELARLTASLLLDMLSSSALGLQKTNFHHLAQFTSDLKKNGMQGRLESVVPGRVARREILAQLHRICQFHNWMERAGADSLAHVRQRLHRELEWPTVPSLTAAQLPARAEHATLQR